MSVCLPVHRPCYAGLMNNVSTSEMELTARGWNAGTAEFVTHDILADYIRDIASAVDSCIQYHVRVKLVEKVNGVWRVAISQLVQRDERSETVESTRVSSSVRECDVWC